MKKITLILTIGLATGLFSFAPFAQAEEEMPPAPEASKEAPVKASKKAAPIEKKDVPAQNASAKAKGDEEEIDVSDLAEEYWRPQKDDLEVVQNKRFTKTGRLEATLLYAFFQSNQYADSNGYGLNLAYNFNERWSIEASRLQIQNHESDFLKSVQHQFGIAPDHNDEKTQTMGFVTWAPVYGKFAFIGEKISHFDFYVSAGAGVTETAEQHFSKGIAIGNRFFIWKNLLLRMEFRIINYTDKIATTQGNTAVKNGGPGYVLDDITRRNLVFGIGWIF